MLYYRPGNNNQTDEGFGEGEIRGGRIGEGEVWCEKTIFIYFIYESVNYTYNGGAEPDLDLLGLLDESQPVPPEQRGELGPPRGLHNSSMVVRET
jgi:hypothetical protein